MASEMELKERESERVSKTGQEREGWQMEWKMVNGGRDNKLKMEMEQIYIVNGGHDE